jgi:hypothetical protein
MSAWRSTAILETEAEAGLRWRCAHLLQRGPDESTAWAVEGVGSDHENRQLRPPPDRGASRTRWERRRLSGHRPSHIRHSFGAGASQTCWHCGQKNRCVRPLLKASNAFRKRQDGHVMNASRATGERATDGRLAIPKGSEFPLGGPVQKSTQVVPVSVRGQPFGCAGSAPATKVLWCASTTTSAWPAGNRNRRSGV